MAHAVPALPDMQRNLKKDWNGGLEHGQKKEKYPCIRRGIRFFLTSLQQPATLASLTSSTTWEAGFLWLKMTNTPTSERTDDAIWCGFRTLQMQWAHCQCTSFDTIQMDLRYPEQTSKFHQQRNMHCFFAIYRKSSPILQWIIILLSSTCSTIATSAAPPVYAALCTQMHSRQWWNLAPTLNPHTLLLVWEVPTAALDPLPQLCIVEGVHDKQQHTQLKGRLGLS